MGKVGKLTTFWNLLSEESVIVIPKVQRDYAYGREEPKVIEVRDGLLDTILSAIKNEKVVILDFVYGGVHIQKGNSGIEPLDGQQRLTTLFLLYFYASLIGENANDYDVESLKKFRYETRQSATTFCESLVEFIRRDLINERDDSRTVSEKIRNNPKYLHSYDSDPTISSMLVVLDVIEKKCKENNIENLWFKLINDSNICFYTLSLDKFGLTDDLYIKMNSRGKRLTEFEIFKADLEKAIGEVAPDDKDTVSKKIDNEWMDILWDYARSLGGDNSEIVNRADEGYMHLFNNVFRLELFYNYKDEKRDRKVQIKDIIKNKQSVKSIVTIFDTISNIHRGEGIEKTWNEYFYFSNEVLGKNDKIRLFWQQDQNRKPVFHLAMDRDLSVPEIVYFYALYKIESLRIKNEIAAAAAFRCLRIIRNLVTANVRANSARYTDLNGFLADVDSIIDNKGIVSDRTYTFIKLSCDEEKYKLDKFTELDYNNLLEYENHSILQGSVILFAKRYEDKITLFDRLEHFSSIFRDDYSDFFDRIRIALLNKDNDYMQYEASMEKDRRYFIHEQRDFPQFFISNNIRQNQDAILDILENIESLDNLLCPEEKCKEFDIDSWQFYMAKYLCSNRQDTRYGCYAWDDIINKPLEIIILNSTQHSPGNIEWKMLNHILISELRDNNVKYSLDPHGSSPVVLNKLGVTLTITQKGWLIECDNKAIVDILKDMYSVTPVQLDNSENQYYLDFIHKDGLDDYIDLAKQIIKDIESNSLIN